VVVSRTVVVFQVYKKRNSGGWTQLLFLLLGALEKIKSGAVEVLARILVLVDPTALQSTNNAINTLAYEFLITNTAKGGPNRAQVLVNTASFRLELLGTFTMLFVCSSMNRQQIRLTKASKMRHSTFGQVRLRIAHDTAQSCT